MVRISNWEADNFFRMNDWILFHAKVTKLQLVINPKKMPRYLLLILKAEKKKVDCSWFTYISFILIISNNDMLLWCFCDTCSLPFRSFMQNMNKKKYTDLQWLPMRVTLQGDFSPHIYEGISIRSHWEWNV